MAAHRLRALPHIEKPEMSRRRLLRGYEALTVIADGQTNGRWRIPQFNGNMLSSSVLYRVGDGFLANTKQVHLHGPRESHRVALNLEIEFRLLAWHQRLDNLRQCRNQISVFQQLATQVP